MKLLHAADIHACREHWPEVKVSFAAMRAYLEANHVDLIALAGDIADGPLQNSERDVFDALCYEIQALANLVPVVMIYGSPGHDAPGSLEVFEKLDSKYGITILRPGKLYWLGSEGSIYAGPVDSGNYPIALLFGVPEPNKKWLLANGEAIGKDASDASARAALRTLFLGLGGMRKEHPDLPCVLLYHGQVSGAKSATGFTVSEGSGLSASKDDFAAVGADYLALGDIHLPQQIGNLPAYYSGKVYTGDWNERDYIPGCNIVEVRMDNLDGVIRSDVSRLEFPHPARKKISTSWPAGEDAFKPNGQVKGFVTWLEATTTKELASGFDVEASLQNLLSHGALPGSRVTLDVLPTETVRASEIVEKASVTDKLMIWAAASSIDMPVSALEKARSLEDERQDSEHGRGAHIRIDRLRLRGAIGTWKKGKKDEVDINLADQGPGVIAFVGPNGYGKTSILENMHPWPSLLTRDGTLKDNFRLKDSCRDLYFTDETTGYHYRALITIRAEIASGQAEYYLYIDKAGTYEAMPGINGRKEPYEAAIADLFGSLEMYLRTAFTPQRPSKYAPDIAAATQGERKALFAELAGIDYLERYRETCKEKIGGLEYELIKLDATITAADGVDERIQDLASEITETQKVEIAAMQETEKALTDGEALAEKREAQASRVVALDQKAIRKAQVEKEIAELLSKIGTDEAAITGFTQAVAGKDAAEAELKRIDALAREVTALQEEKSKLETKDRTCLESWQETENHIVGQQRQAEQAASAARANAEEPKRALARLEATREALERELAEPLVDKCLSCDQKLPPANLAHMQAARAETQKKVDEIRDEEAKKRDEIAGILENAAKAEALAKERPENPKPMPSTFAGQDRLETIAADLAFITDTEVQRGILRKAEAAAVRIDEARQRIKTQKEKQAELEGEGKALAEELLKRDFERTVLEELEERLKAQRSRYSEAKAQASSAKATREATEKSLTEAKERQAARDVATEHRVNIGLDLADWVLLEKGTGPNGIQALELDALAPSIVAVSNKLLNETFGNRYKIEIRTTRIAGTGKKTKQVEDFEIFIIDSETGEEQEIATLSGGESVWIKKALYDGFSIIRAKNTGTQFSTAFLDEADGALDPEARQRYLRMLQAAHKESGRYQTILVTHSKELQAMVEKTIDVRELNASTVGVAQ